MIRRDFGFWVFLLLTLAIWMALRQLGVVQGTEK